MLTKVKLFLMKNNYFFQNKKICMRIAAASFYVFAKTLMSNFIKRLLNAPFCSFGQVLWFLVLVEKRASHRYAVGKGRSLLIAILDNCGYFSLMLHQSPQNGSFLEVCCSVGSETLFLWYVEVDKAIGLFCTLNRFCTHMWFFLTPSIDYLGNMGSLSGADLPNVDIFHYPISKSHIC